MKTLLHDSVCRVLRDEVEAHGWSHAEAARRTGINKTSITRMLGGKRRITLDALYRFSRAMKRKAADLVKQAEKG